MGPAAAPAVRAATPSPLWRAAPAVQGRIRRSPALVRLGASPGPAAGLASRWARLGAALVDIILVGAVITLVTWPFLDYDRILEGPRGEEVFVPAGQWAANFLGAFLAFLYYWLMTYKWGRTLGKMALGIQVVRAADGGAVTQGQAAGRSAFYSVLGGLCACIGLIDVLWLLWDERRQCLHDKVAGTVVRKMVPGSVDPYAGR
ncbi:RDD family protein [Thermomonospora amylolytica]|uniref:RDD family protein n=1 Tax=Thermomonospora amylolytica TaxID=1411117 RepID=UPI000E6CE862|nr:RDD family protein [Thermomonospora amylolytica]